MSTKTSNIINIGATETDDYDTSAIICKLDNGINLWYTQGEGDAIKEIKLVYNEDPPGDDFIKIDTNLNSGGKTTVYLCYRTKGKGSPIIVLKVIPITERIGRGFGRVDLVLNPNAGKQVPSQILCFKTIQSQKKT